MIPKRPLLLLAAGLACVALPGPEAAGRLALRAGLPHAAMLLSDPVERGLALYRAAEYEAADAALAAAGRRQTFNRALTLAATGRHALSVDYLDAVLFANPGDAEAQSVRDLVDKLVPKVRGESVAPGRIAAVDGAEDPAARPTEPDPERGKPIEARGFAASEAWLETITDDPGEFLRLRLEKEFERRAGLGMIRPAKGERW